MISGFKINMDKIAELKKIEQQKQQELQEVFKTRNEDIIKIGNYISEACNEIEIHKKETGITQIEARIPLNFQDTVYKTKSVLCIDVDVETNTDIFSLSPRMETDLEIKAIKAIGSPSDRITLFRQDEKKLDTTYLNRIGSKILPVRSLDITLAYLANNKDKICEDISKVLSEKIEKAIQNKITTLDDRITVTKSEETQEELY